MLICESYHQGVQKNAHLSREREDKVIETFFLRAQEYVVFYPFHYVTEIIFSAY